MAREIADELAEALDPLVLAQRMGLLQALSDEEKAALRDVDAVRAARGPVREGVLAVGTVGGLVANAWDCFYGSGAEERAAWERACEKHDPKGWARRKAEMAARPADDGELEAKLKQMAVSFAPDYEPQTHAEALALLVFGAGEEN